MKWNVLSVFSEKEQINVSGQNWRFLKSPHNLRLDQTELCFQRQTRKILVNVNHTQPVHFQGNSFSCSRNIWLLKHKLQLCSNMDINMENVYIFTEPSWRTGFLSWFLTCFLHRETWESHCCCHDYPPVVTHLPCFLFLYFMLLLLRNKIKWSLGKKISSSQLKVSPNAELFMATFPEKLPN